MEARHTTGGSKARIAGLLHSGLGTAPFASEGPGAQQAKQGVGSISSSTHPMIHSFIYSFIHFSYIKVHGSPLRDMPELGAGDIQDTIDEIQVRTPKSELATGRGGGRRGEGEREGEEEAGGKENEKAEKARELTPAEPTPSRFLRRGCGLSSIVRGP